MEGLSVKVTLLILIAVFSLTVKAEDKKLDMAPDAVDNNFSQCRDKMLKAVTEPGGLLQEELNTNKMFKDLWDKYNGTCKKNITGGTSDHISALEVYANSKSSFRKDFNNLVYSKGSNSTTYRDGFPFKSLHFLLTDSLRLLNPTNSCQTVYYGTANIYTVTRGTEVRFGKFLQAKTTQSSAMEEVTGDKGTVFNITSCSVVNVEKSVCKSEEIQCLISPTEVFRVMEVREVKTVDGTYREITLTHSRVLSNQTCHFFTRSEFPHVGSSATLVSFRILVAVMSHVLASLLLVVLL